MKRRLSVRMLMLTVPRLIVVVSMLGMVYVSFAEPAVTVYKDPT